MPLEQAHAADPSDLDTALLLGIAYFRSGKLADARPLLDQAEHSTDPDSAASARVFLGLIAERTGEAERAQDYYALVARSSTSLGASGRLLLDQTGTARWTLSAVSRVGYDSNVALQPFTVTHGRGHSKSPGDGELSLIAAASERPVSGLPLIADQSVLYRRYVEQTEFDMLSALGGATYTLANRTDRAILAYHLEASTLGGSRYDLAHVVDVGGRHAFAGGVAATARYQLGAHGYGQGFEGYSGVTNAVMLGAARGTARTPYELTGGYVWERDSTDDRALAWTGNGLHAGLRTRLSSTVELRLTGLASDRLYSAESGGRRDLALSLDGSLFVDLSDVLAVVAGGSLVRNVSNDVAEDYTKLVVFVGLIAATGR